MSRRCSCDQQVRRLFFLSPQDPSSLPKEISFSVLTSFFLLLCVLTPTDEGGSFKRVTFLPYLVAARALTIESLSRSYRFLLVRQMWLPNATQQLEDTLSLSLSLGSLRAAVNQLASILCHVVTTRTSFVDRKLSRPLNRLAQGRECPCAGCCRTDGDQVCIFGGKNRCGVSGRGRALNLILIAADSK